MTLEGALMKDDDAYWRRLLHRWLIEYNPLYLISATLVLSGMIVTSRGLAREGSLYGEIGVAAIAELYAVALIGGAALLTRIGHRRPAVMLAMLAVLYQCDLTLHTETCTYLGSAPVGAAASMGWLALFVGKLYALAWAMKLRVSRAAQATAGLAALGLAVLPHYLHDFEPRTATALVAAWLFGIFVLHGTLHAHGVTSASPLDAWGATVLRRGVRTAWSLAAFLFVGHVAFWSTQHDIALAALLPVVPLLAARRLRTERQAWFLVVATLACVAIAMPAAFSLTALLGTASLALRALLPSVRAPWAAPVLRRDDAGPYRALDPERPPHADVDTSAAELVPVPPELVLVSHAERTRLLTGALFGAYLGVWTLGWTGGAWPAHVLALDVALAVAVALVAWRARTRLVLVPLALGAMHLVVASHLVPTPRTLVGWGGTAVVLGFALLLVSLAASYRLRRSEHDPGT
jgi:hypothetical protein